MKGVSLIFLSLVLLGCGNSVQFSDRERDAELEFVDLGIDVSSDLISNTDKRKNHSADSAPDLDAGSDVESGTSECESIRFLGVANQFNPHVEMVKIEGGFVVLWESSNSLEVRILDEEGTVLSGQKISRDYNPNDQPPQLFRMEDSFLILYKSGEDIRFRSKYSSGWGGRSANFRGTYYQQYDGWFPLIVQLDDRWVRLGSNGARLVELPVGERSSGLSWDGRSILSAFANADELGISRSGVLDGSSEFVHEWRSDASPYAKLRYSKNAREGGRHAALLGTTVLIEGAPTLNLDGVLTTRAVSTPTNAGDIYWNGESYSILLLGVDAPGEIANGYLFEVDENGTQIGESKKLFSTKNVQHSREELPAPALVASSQNRIATAWIEGGSQVFFGCFRISE